MWNCDEPIGNANAEYFDVPQLSLNEVNFVWREEKKNAYFIAEMADVFISVTAQVFISENIPALVSYLDIAVDDGELTTTKNSGICVCTGSGSSSWNFSMNRISREVVDKLFTLGGHKTNNVHNIVDAYNSSLRYAPGTLNIDTHSACKPFDL